MSMPPGSPRLPSPPPPAEIQIGPKSPMMRPHPGRQGLQTEQPGNDANSKRRIRPGTKAVDMATGPPLVALDKLDSAFQHQEHLAALHYHLTAHNTGPVTREHAKRMATPPQGTDKTLWLYELCRFLVNQCNSLIVGFLFDSPPCSATTCPEMRASEWQFLCAVHDQPKSCCAIDYCCHTLDWAANVATNPKIFPSRVGFDPHDKNTAIKNIVNIFRRVHRIFAHAWFQHRGVFWSVENQSGLYILFKTVCDTYDLLPAENYKLPPEAEGLDISMPEDELETTGSGKRQSTGQIITIAKPPGGLRAEGDDDNYPLVNRTNTRRHIKSSPSVGSAITSVPEADEDDGSGADLTSRLRQMRISSESLSQRGSFSEEVELSTIPVIVEHGPLAHRDPPVRPSSVIPPPSMSGAAPSSREQQLRHDLEMSFSPEPEEQPESVGAPAPKPETEQQQPEIESEEEVSSASDPAEPTLELSQSDEEQFEEFLREESTVPAQTPGSEALDSALQEEDSGGEQEESKETTAATATEKKEAAAAAEQPESKEESAQDDASDTTEVTQLEAAEAKGEEKENPVKKEDGSKPPAEERKKKKEEEPSSSSTTQQPQEELPPGGL